jgi:hypothetical protein
VVEAARISGTPVNFYQTRRCKNPEDGHILSNTPSSEINRRNVEKYVIYLSDKELLPGTSDTTKRETKKRM